MPYHFDDDSNAQDSRPENGAALSAQSEADRGQIGTEGDDILATPAPSIFNAEILPMNDSGVTGTATVTVEGDQLTVTAEISGLTPGQTHLMHIHGRADPDTGLPLNSTNPTEADDTDGDGFIELAEGAVSVGPVIVPLTSPPGGAAADFPTATTGTITFEETYDLAAAETFADGFSAGDLFPLDLRVVHLHGLEVEEGAGEGTPGEVDGTAGFKPGLPIATGELAPAEDEAVEAAATTPAILMGGAGNDVLIGGNGDDALAGEAGNDVLAGGAGDNVLFGGEGGDFFVLGAGRDMIIGFSADEGDRLVPATNDDVEAIVAEAEDGSEGATITTETGSLTLVGMAASDVTVDWFAV